MYNKELGTCSLQRSLERAAVKSKCGSSKLRDKSEKHITSKYLNIRVVFWVTSHTSTYNTQSFSDSPQTRHKTYEINWASKETWRKGKNSFLSHRSVVRHTIRKNSQKIDLALSPKTALCINFHFSSVFISIKQKNRMVTASACQTWSQHKCGLFSEITP